MRIPVYQQGKGVRKPTTQLGLKADTQAFVGSALETVDFFKKAEKVQFEFQMAEKKAQTERAYKELKTQYNDGANELIRNSKSTTSADFQKELNKFNDGFKKNYAKYNLTPNQTRDIETNLLVFKDSKLQVGKQSSFNRGREQGSIRSNELINGFIGEIRTLAPGNPLREKLIRDMELEYARAYDSGETAFLDYKNLDAAKQEIKLSDYAYKAETINSVESLAKANKQLNEDLTLTTSQRMDISNAYESKYNDNIDKNTDGILTSLMENQFTADTLENVKKQVSNPKTNIIKVGKQSYNISGYDKDNRIKLLSEINGLQSNNQTAETKDNVKALSKFINNTTSLLKLKNEEKLIETKSGKYAGITEQTKFTLLKKLQSEIREAQRNAQIIVKSNTEQIKQSVLINNEITEPTKKKIKETKNYLGLVDETGTASKQFDSVLRSLNDSLVMYEELKYSTNADFNKKIADLNLQISNSKGDMEKQLSLNETKESLQKLQIARTKQINNDAYGFFENLLQKDGNVDITRSQVLAKQRRAGVSTLDLKFFTSAQETKFLSDFKLQVGAQEKATMFQEFVKDLSFEERLLFINNLRVNNKIQLSDEIIVNSLDASGNINLGVIDLGVANNPEIIEQAKKINKKSRELIDKEVTNQFKNYAFSVHGQVTTDYEFAPGAAKDSRVIHTQQMENEVTKLANHYHMLGASETQAATKAANTLVNRLYEFETINDGIIRIPKEVLIQQQTSLSSPSNDFRKVLQTFLKDDTQFYIDNVSSIAGDTSNQYAKEVVKDGYWMTSSNNESVFLLDKTGNPVMFESEDEQGLLTLRPVKLKFSDIAETIPIFSEGGLIADKEKKIRTILKEKYFND